MVLVVELILNGTNASVSNELLAFGQGPLPPGRKLVEIFTNRCPDSQ